MASRASERVDSFSAALRSERDISVALEAYTRMRFSVHNLDGGGCRLIHGFFSDWGRGSLAASSHLARVC